MRVLVTGASGVFGRTICRDLVRQGADVVAFARRAVEVPGVASIRGDIRDEEALTAAMAGCGRVVHLAFVLAPLRSSTGVDEINIGGTANVLRAMEVNGVEKLVFTSSTLAYGPWADNPEVVTESQVLRPHPEVMYAKHKALCEELIEQSGIPSVITRTCVVAGRDMDNYEFRFLAHPALAAPRGPMKPWQFMHTDDVGRFHTMATLNDRTGIVNVGPEDRGITIDEIAEVLGKPLVRMPFGLLKGVAGAAWRADVLELSPADLDGFRYMPTLDTTRMVEEWGYRPVYDSRSALEDAAAGVRAVTYLGTAKVPTPWRLPAPDHQWTYRPAPADEHAVDPAPPGLGGEFDDLIDSRYPTLTTANVGEAFGGTLTPMSLWVSRDAMRVSGANQVELLNMTDSALVAAQRSLAIASVGHRLFTNVSVVHAMAEAMPGTSVREVDEHVLGIPHDPSAPTAKPDGATARQLRSLPGVGLRIAGVGRRVAAVEQRVVARVLSEEHLRALDDNALLSRIDTCRELVIDAWTYSTTTNLVASAAQSLVRRIAPELGLAGLRSGVEGLASAALLGGVQDLAARARANPEMERALRGADLTELVGMVGSVDRAFAAAFDQLLRAVGHRGPGEAELANRMYGDDPAKLLDAVLKALDAPTRVRTGPSGATPARAKPALRMLGRAVRRRESAKDVAMRATHTLRLALREVGRRQVAAGVFENEGDIFYLIPEEVAAPHLHAHKVDGRRSERGRLAALQLPSVFTLGWEPVDSSGGILSEGLSGLGVSAGTASGPVQILRDGDDDLEPGSVLVTHVTDVGWTALFASAAAIVTDVGGLHSHAAVVAREFGIPCVVATESATRVLKDGQMVFVDGDAGTVTPV